MSADSGTIATAFVVIRPQTKGFKEQTTKELETPMKGVATRIAGAFAAGFIIRGAAKKLFVDPIKSAGDFQKELNVLWATADHGKVKLGDISKAAIKLGNDAHLPAVSAKDAADAMLELARGGFTAQQAMGAARGTLLLATAAQIDNAQAADILSDSLHEFGLEATDAARVTDLLAGAANRSTTGVPQIALALSQVGASAHALHVPIEDTVAAITQLANAGIKGSDAGTSLKTAFQRLNPSTKQAQAEVKKLGIDVFDNNGKFIGLHGAIGQYTKALSGMTDQQKQAAINTIFGSDAARAANVLLTKGTKVYDDNRKAVEKRGQAQKLANAQTKGFSGAIAGLSNAFETLQLELGLKLLPVATRFTRFLTSIAGAKNFKVAIQVAIKGIESFAGDAAKWLNDQLFGKSTTIAIGGEGRASRVVVSPGLIAQIQDAVSAIDWFGGKQSTLVLGGEGRATRVTVSDGLVGAIQTAMAEAVAKVDWAQVGQTIGAAIGGAVKITQTAFDSIGDAAMAYANSHSSQFGAIGLKLALNIVATALDPGFWVRNWSLILGVALSLLPVGRLGLVGGRIAEFMFGKLGALITPWIVRGLEKLPVVLGDAAAKGAGALGRAIAKWGPVAVREGINLVERIIDGIAGKFGKLAVFVQPLLYSGVVQTIVKMAGAAASAAGNLATAVKNRIVSGFNAVKTATSQWLSTMVAWIGGLPSRVASTLGDLSGVLVNAGSQLIGGLWTGMKAKFVDVKNWAGNLAGEIASVKGPLDYDRVLLVPHGKAIMQGLQDGMQSRKGSVLAMAHALGGNLADGLVGGLKKANLGSQLTASLTQSVREAVTAGKRNLQSLTAGIASDIGTVIDAATARLNNPLQAGLDAGAAARQERDLKNSVTAAEQAAASARTDLTKAQAAQAKGPALVDSDGTARDPADIQSDTEDLATAVADANAAILQDDQDLGDAREDLANYYVQNTIDANNKVADSNKETVTNQIALWTEQFNQGKISQQDFFADITQIVTQYTAGDGMTAYTNMGDLLGKTFADTFIAHLGDITDQIGEIVKGGVTQGGAALGQDAPTSATQPVQDQLATAQKALTKARADLAVDQARYNKDLAAIEVLYGKKQTKSVIDAEQVILKRLATENTEVEGDKRTITTNADLVAALKPLVDAAAKVTVGTIVISDPAIAAGILAAAR